MREECAEKKKPTIQEIIRELHAVSGFRIALYNAEDGKEVCACPKAISSLCARIQENPEGLRRCLENDRKAFRKVKETGEVYLYRCHAGLYEAAAPLYDGDVLTGYLMMGQTVDSMTVTREDVLRRAERYVDIGSVTKEDDYELRRIVAEIPDRRKDQILSCVRLMEICAGYITLSRRFQASGRQPAQEAKHYMDMHFGETITLESLCRQFHVSRATLAGSFRKTYGISIHQYLMEKRLREGKRLLEDYSMSVSQAAELAGFRDANYFTKAFRRRYKMTPSEYRKGTRDTEVFHQDFGHIRG